MTQTPQVMQMASEGEIKAAAEALTKLLGLAPGKGDRSSSSGA
jgi:hypothetical protein